METTTLKIEGMMCDACIAAVSKALNGVEGVRTVAVDLQAGQATVHHENANAQVMSAAIEDAGYHVKEA